MEIKEKKLFSSLPYFTETLHNSFLLNCSTGLLLSKPSSLYLINNAGLASLFLQLGHSHLCSLLLIYVQFHLWNQSLHPHPTVSRYGFQEHLVASQKSSLAHFYPLPTNSAFKREGNNLPCSNKWVLHRVFSFAAQTPEDIYCIFMVYIIFSIFIVRFIYSVQAWTHH